MTCNRALINRLTRLPVGNLHFGEEHCRGYNVPMPKLTLNLLGGFQARLDDQPLTGFISAKVRALLVYLALEAEQPHSRSHLAGLFWPEWPETQARAYLRHTLTNLRQVLCEAQAAVPFLLVTRQSIQFNPVAEQCNDAQSLNLLLSSALANNAPPHLGQLGAALVAYAPLLPDFSVDGCPEFEAWLLLRRERLQRQVLDALQQLADYHHNDGAYEQAIAYAQRAVELEPWREEVHRQLIALFATVGRRSAAVAQYLRCKQLLWDELSITPSDETVALYERIAGVDADGVLDAKPPTPSPLPVFSATRQNNESDDRRLPLPHNNLPAPLTALVGRQAETAAVMDLLRQDGVRLVTLTGPAGVGKTRLATAAAAELTSVFTDGVCFVPLAPLHADDMVIAAIAQLFNIRETSGHSLLERVQLALHTKRMLLVLDNFEHLLAAGSVVTSLLRTCPQLKIMVTSRELLQLYGEHEFVVQSLATPPLSMQSSRRAPEDYPSVALFIERAKAAKAEFIADREQIAMVAELCTQLDGLPLAIELAAAEVKFFSLPALHRQLVVGSGPLPLQRLQARARDLPARHQTLQRAIAWSYELLNQEEQLLFRRLSIFVGGFTPEAVCALYVDPAESEALLQQMLAVVWPDPQLVDPASVQPLCPTLLAGADADTDVVLHKLHALVNKSLIRSEISLERGVERFTLLETIRAFGLMQLNEHGELTDVQLRCLRYYLTLAVDAETQLNGADDESWLARLTLEYHNLRSAMAWAVTHNLIEIAMRLGCALFHFWARKGHEREGAEQLAALLPVAKALSWTPLYARFLFSAALLHDYYSGDRVRSKPIYEESLAVSRAVGDELKAAHALNRLSGFAYTRGDYDTWARYLEEAQHCRRNYGDLFGYALVGGHTGKEFAQLGRMAEGRAACAEALQLNRAIGDKWGTILTLWNYGQLALLDNSLAEAETLLTECLSLSEDLNDNYLIAQAQLILGRVTTAQGQLDRAQRILSVALQTMYELTNRDGMINGLEAFARLAVEQQKPAEALRLTTIVARERAVDGAVLPPLLQACFDQIATLARQQLTDAVAERDITCEEPLELHVAVQQLLH